MNKERQKSQELFLQKFKDLIKYPDSPMPWDAFAKMSEDDLGVIFKYLQTVEPCEKEVGVIVTNL